MKAKQLIRGTIVKKHKQKGIKMLDITLGQIYTLTVLITSLLLIHTLRKEELPITTWNSLGWATWVIMSVAGPLSILFLIALKHDKIYKTLCKERKLPVVSKPLVVIITIVIVIVIVMTILVNTLFEVIS